MDWAAVVGLQSCINATHLEQFRQYVRGMPPQELMAIREIITAEVARQRALPAMPQCDGASAPQLVKQSSDPSPRSLCISLDWISG